MTAQRRNSARRPGESYQDCVDRLIGEKRALELDVERLQRERDQWEAAWYATVVSHLDKATAARVAAKIRSLLLPDE